MSDTSELEGRLRADLTTSMKAKDTRRTATLRMLLAAVQTEKVSGKAAHDLTDDDILAVLAKEAKKRAESAQIYTDNGREELAAIELAESAVIAQYLPTPLSDGELTALVDTAVETVTAQLGEAPTVRQMGQVMKLATAAARGRADGARVSAAVKARLQ